MELSYQTIQQQAATLTFLHQAFINGQYVNAQSGRTFACLNPATGERVAHVAACDSVDVDAAVKCSRSSFASGVWSERSPSERKKILLKLADLLDQHQMTLALMETVDTGKPIADSLKIDVYGAIKLVRWYAEAIDKMYGQIAPTAQTILALITREPVGVVAAVTPWNYPLYLACSKIVPALAAGNSVIIKPAEQTPLTTIYLAKLASEAGIPEGVLNVLPGLGETAGKAIGLHPDIDCVSFTGSTEVGKLFLKYSAESNMKRIFLECGGKSPNIIFADCKEVDKAAEVTASEVFLNQGEVCCAPTRLLVQRHLKESVLEKLVIASRKFYPADPLDPQTHMGAVIDQAQLEKILSYVESAKIEGADLVLGGKKTHEHTGGYFIEPTIFADVNNAMKIAQEEVFGPVLSVITFDTMEQAIQIANDTQYGLAAAVWTQDINKAHKVAKALRVGVVSINCINTGDITTPFGGYKQSGIGREQSLHVFDHYTELKTTWIDLGSDSK